MELIIYVNENFEEEKALFDLEEEKLILSGDYYHDKIDGKIEGYLKALEDFKIYNKKVETVEIKENHKLYEKMKFQE